MEAPIGSPIQVLRTALEHGSADSADAAAVAAFVGLSPSDAKRLRGELEQALRAIGRLDAADTLVAAPLPQSPRDVAGLMGIAKCFQGISTDELKASVSVPHTLARASDQAAELWQTAKAKHDGGNGSLGNRQWLSKISEFDRQLQRAGLCPEETARAVIAAIYPAITALGRSPYADGAAQLDQAGRVLGPLLNVIELRLANAGDGRRHFIDDNYHGATPHIAFQHIARGWFQDTEATLFFVDRNSACAQRWAAESPAHKEYLGLMTHLRDTLREALDRAPRP